MSASTGFSVNVDGVYKDVQSYHLRTESGWIEVVAIYVLREGGEWALFYGAA